jgi:tight adherence protein B
MRRWARITFLVATLAAAGALSPAGRAAEGPRLANVGGARFPERAYILSLPHELRLVPGQVRVLESGNRVSRLSVVPAAAAGEKQFGVVLVIDASLSMRGRAIGDAVEAARAFADRRNHNQQLGVVAFNRTPTVLAPLTTDDEAIDSALASPPRLKRGTHVYDAVDRALSLLRDAKVASGSVVVLSDGADTGSLKTPEAIDAAARAAHVRIFSVGIRSRSFRPRPLERLAAGAAGAYSEARTSEELTGIYDELGAQLANEYLIRYRSFAGPGERIRVRVSVDGVGATATGYVTPALSTVPEPPFRHSLAYRFWLSPITMVAVSLLAAALVAAGFVLLLRPRGRSLRKRMAEFVSLRLPSDAGDQAGSLTGRVLVGAERSLESRKWWSHFKETIELAEIGVPAVHVLAWTAIGTLVVMWILSLIGGLLLALLGLAVPWGVRTFVNRKADRTRNRFAEQLPDNLQVLASALRAGHSFVGALSVVVDEAEEPARSEFRRVVADEQLGVALEDAIDVVARRMDNPDLEQVALVAALQRQSGGNMAEVLDRVTETIRERFELRRMVRTLTAQGRMSRWVVSALPVLLLGALSVLNPTYLAPLFTTTVGNVLLVLGGLMVVTGSLVIKRIVEIEV